MKALRLKSTGEWLTEHISYFSVSHVHIPTLLYGSSDLEWLKKHFKLSPTDKLSWDDVEIVDVSLYVHQDGLPEYAALVEVLADLYIASRGVDELNDTDAMVDAETLLHKLDVLRYQDPNRLFHKLVSRTDDNAPEWYKVPN